MLSQPSAVQAASVHRPKASPRRMLLPEILPGWDTLPPARARGGAQGPPPWAALTEAVAELLDGTWCGKQRLFVRHFVFQAGARRTEHPGPVPRTCTHHTNSDYSRPGYCPVRQRVYVGFGVSRQQWAQATELYLLFASCSCLLRRARTPAGGTPHSKTYRLRTRLHVCSHMRRAVPAGELGPGRRPGGGARGGGPLRGGAGRRDRPLPGSLHDQGLRPHPVPGGRKCDPVQM